MKDPYGDESWKDKPLLSWRMDKRSAFVKRASEDRIYKSSSVTAI